MMGHTRNAYITEKTLGKCIRVIGQNRRSEYVKVSFGETIMKAGDEKNGLKIVFNGWLYQKRF
jgi:hypothetical protein